MVPPARGDQLDVSTTISPVMSVAASPCPRSWTLWLPRPATAAMAYPMLPVPMIVMCDIWGLPLLGG